MAQLNQTGFNEWAGNYDASIAQDSKGFPFEGYYNLLACIQQKITIQSASKVLDIGIGTGLLSHELYKQGAQIYGMDFAKKMLHQAQQKMPNAHLMLGDFTQPLPPQIASEQFDYIISSYVLHHANDEGKIAFIQNILANLRPKGQLIIGDIAFETADKRQQYHQQYAAAWDEDEFYFAADELLPLLAAVNIKAHYQQISFCAGVLYIVK